METPSTLPRTLWPERIVAPLAAALAAVGAASIFGWWFQSDLLLRPFGSMEPIKFNGAVTLLLLGALVLGLEFKVRRATWLAVVPFALSTLTLTQDVFQTNWNLDELIVRDTLSVANPHPGRISPISSLVLALVSISLWWRGRGTAPRLRLLVEAAIGSLACSAGITTLLGHAAGLPAVYTWGTSAVTSPVMAVGMLLAGAVGLVLAWREAMTQGNGPPAWLPLPAIVACLTLTLVLWIGLREREQTYLGARTQTAMDALAVQINSEFDRQANDIEKIARRWSEANQNNEVIWEADAITLMSASQVFGCDSASPITPGYEEDGQISI